MFLESGVGMNVNNVCLFGQGFSSTVLLQGRSDLLSSFYSWKGRERKAKQLMLSRGLEEVRADHVPESESMP